MKLLILSRIVHKNFKKHIMGKHIKIIGTAYPYRGGLAEYNERLALEFVREGDTVEIETFSMQYPGILFPGKTQYGERKVPTDFSIKRTVNSINPISWIKTGKRIKKEKPDIVIIKYWIPFMAPCFGTIARIIRKNHYTKIICIADNIIPHESRPGDNLLTGYFINSIDGIVAMSQKVYNDVLHFDDKLPRALCPHPLFDNFGESITREKALSLLKLDPSFNYLLFFGFVREYKGLDLLLKALAHPAIKKMKLKLIVAGEFYTKEKPYIDLIKEFGLQDMVTIINKFIANNEVNRYFCSADMIVQPYKTATQSGVTQIGYHFNKPMLVTDVGGLSEIIPDQKVGYVVPPDDEHISEAIIDFYKNNRKKEFETNVLIEKKKFSWENMVQSVKNISHKNNTK